MNGARTHFAAAKAEEEELVGSQAELEAARRAVELSWKQHAGRLKVQRVQSPKAQLKLGRVREGGGG